MRINRTVVLGFSTAVFLATAVAIASAGENVLYTFQGGNDCQPYGALISDLSGNLYGTTSGDRFSHPGTAYELTPGSGGTWTETVLHTFGTGTDGRNPVVGMVRDSAGNLYGTTPIGGASNHGVVFELSPGSNGWTETILYAFTGGNDGAMPYAIPVFDQAGNLYGVTSQGGSSNQGVAFELSPGSNGWTEKVLYTFSGGNDGGWPIAPLVFDQAGNLYGTASQGGAGGWGTVFKLTPASNGWVQSVLYAYTGGNDGAQPQSPIVRDRFGNLYSTATGGGTGEAGVVFQVRPPASAAPSFSGTWNNNVLYNFMGEDDGSGPNNGVVFDQVGNLDGVAPTSGSGGYGVVYQLTPGSTGWSQNVLYSFTGGADGGFPESPAILDGAGNIDGTTIAGGQGNCGVAYQISAPALHL